MIIAKERGSRARAFQFSQRETARDRWTGHADPVGDLERRLAEQHRLTNRAEKVLRRIEDDLRITIGHTRFDDDQLRKVRGRIAGVLGRPARRYINGA